MAKRKNKRILIMSLAVVILSGVLPFDTYVDINSVVRQIGIDGIAIAADTEEDKIKPVIDYAYVENGRLKLSISDNEKLARRPIIYRINKEVRSYDIHIDDYKNEYDGRKKAGKVYEIRVEIPSTISITVMDWADNENTYKFNIKEDNVPLTKYVPEYVLENLAESRQSEVNRFRGFEDVFELEYGKVVDAFSLYDDVITDSYYSYSKKDIKIKVSGLSTDKDGNIKLDKYGIFKVTMTHSKDKTFKETAYILIKPDWRKPENRRIPSNVSPYIVYKDRIKVADYFRYEDEAGNKKGKSKIDTSYMLVYNEDTDETVTMNDQINLELNKLYRLSVLNFEDDSEQDFYIMRQEKTKSTNKNFTDVNKDYWGSKDINSLVSKGLLSGYPDGTFRPIGNISVKEFMTILGRQIALTPTKGKPIVGNVTVPTSSSSWGYIETKSILDRIPSTDLFRFNYLNLDRHINREEVAFLIDKALELGVAYNTDINKSLSDVGLSSYPSEFTKLVNLGLISGYPDGTFRPKHYISRAEIAALFTRIK